MNFPRGPGSRGISLFSPFYILYCRTIRYDNLFSEFEQIFIFVERRFNFYLSRMNKILRPFCFCLLFLSVFGFQFSCADHDFPTYNCPDNEVSYLEDIKPILESKCAISGCHNGSLGADRDWSNFNVFQENAQNGDVKNFVTNRIMPPASSPAGGLSQDQINAIACWIDDGAPNN